MNVKNPIFLLLFALFGLGCFDPKEGCLDIAATNFDASADEDCCCTYPGLIFSVDQKWDTKPFRRDSVFALDNGKLIRLHNVLLYLSDFQMERNGAAFKTTDTIQLQAFAKTGQDTIKEVYLNDFELISLDNSTANTGVFRTSGNFDAVQFRFGLSNDANRVIASKVRVGHPLRPGTDSLWLSKTLGYALLKVVFSPDTLRTSPRDSVLLTRADMGDLFFRQTGKFSSELGYDFRLRMNIDLKKLLGKTNWSIPDKTQWKKEIIANLPGAFNVSQ
jgi:hypothetical protein